MNAEQHRLDTVHKNVPKNPETEAVPSAGDDASVLARHSDPSMKARTATARGVDRLDPRSVAWVRISDVMSASTAQLAGRGISFEAELHRRIRRLPTQTVAASKTAISNRTHHLPPLSAFGRSRSHDMQGPARSGVGIAR